MRAVGWEAAKEVGYGTWSGWEAEFLRIALVILAEADRDATMIEQAALWRSFLGGGTPTNG